MRVGGQLEADVCTIEHTGDAGVRACIEEIVTRAASRTDLIDARNVAAS